MKKTLWLIITLSGLLYIAQAQDNSRTRYINRFKDIAISEMERTGVPASIKLAQGILESGAGESTLARKANNHFGIKCHSDWRGKKYYHEDDDYDENGNLIKSCFRVYKNPNSSYIAHSEFLRDPKKKFRYGFLFRLDPTDYKAWARGLKKAGYATSPTYAEKLIRIIESYELNRFDRMTTGEELGPDINEEYLAGIRKNNSVKYVLASGQENAEDIADRTDKKLKCIQKYNEKLGDPRTKLKANTRVYLQRKRNGYRGKRKWHYVKKGETMYSIAQLYGVRLSKLLSRNRLEEGEQPALDERIKLRGWRIRNSEKPILSTEVFDDRPENTEFEELLFEEEEEDFGNDLEMEINGEVGVEDFEVPDLEEEEPAIEEPVPPTPDPPVVDPPSNDPDPVAEPIEEPQATYHTVAPGDTLFAISKKYNTTVDAIQALNGMTTTIIKVGEWLRVR
ncbi:MAG: glucosaminidase domain-containing protein [Bacteroidota bacterium]